MPSMPSMPSMSMSDWGLKPGTYGTQSVTLAVESDPPGAEARASTGAAVCRTPCSLALTAAGDFTVSVSLNGYLPQSVPVKLIPPEDPRFASDGAAQGARVDPNPIFVELEKAPPPPPPAKKRAPAKKPVARRAPPPATAAAPAQAPAPAPMTAPAPAAAQPAASSSAPWPMPR